MMYFFFLFHVFISRLFYFECSCYLVESESYYFSAVCYLFTILTAYSLFLARFTFNSNLFRIQHNFKCSSAPKYQKIIEAYRGQYKSMNHWLLSLPTFAFAVKGSKSRRTNTMIRSQLIAWNTGTVILTIVPLAR